MNWFKKKESSIPPVAGPPPPSSLPAASRYTPQTYVPSRDAGAFDSVAYSASTGRGPPPDINNAPSYDKYNRNRHVGDAYSRGDGGRQVDQDRNELFSGYDASKSGSGRFFDGGNVPQREPGQETDDDVEGIKKQTRYVKQESVASTRNALQMAREAEETARNTLVRLGDQSEKLASTERHLDVSKGYSLRAEDKTGELKQLNRSIFRPVVSWNKDKQRMAQQQKIEERYEDERDAREKAMLDVRETQQRIGRATTYGQADEDELLGGRRAQGSSNKEGRKRFQFDATASDDELEDEMDGNLDEISRLTKSLNVTAKAMNQELDAQNSRITRISDKTDNLNFKIDRNTERLKKI
ncbi:hypothetical protein FA15DRAFT_662429 [Coprinopsis marcescibilis]|uniref:t-SNARE coiled-coil homology domain-containing protein n=1 Tax=Coprinopsis marcescibilis TaxID=230819 RepID=A0A5C3LCW4_COPMA|nr:hypothetical protein FA15DRAFT_662429 [Coprinopsis marcescibilis]